ncbi:MAG: hypothetical protein M3365_09925 [Gemmatimonadota bacterium]|nr:hypothetical protein [Gemmatimonadota bacterium]
MTMPANKDLKRLVRARMKKTGEAYTAARAQITRKANPKTATAPTTAPAASRASYAELAGMSDAVIKEKTGCAWDSWVFALDHYGAAEMPHRDIAALVRTKYKIPGWWAQWVTVGYERIKGLRARGQRRDGSYEAGKSRTFDVPVTRLFDAWADPTLRKRWLTDAGINVRTATAPKTMRLGWSDGTIVVVGFMAKGKSKSSVALAHTKLPNAETANRLKVLWSKRLDALGKLFNESREDKR